MGARSKENENWPNVYTMNTFFLPKLMKTGFDAIKRWTRKVDIFSFDIILVPVHLDVHWCLAVMNLKKKSVNFYDSMGSDKKNICIRKVRLSTRRISLWKMSKKFPNR